MKKIFLVLFLTSCAHVEQESVFPIINKHVKCITGCGIETNSLTEDECLDFGEYENEVTAVFLSACDALKGFKLSVIDTQNGVFRTSDGKTWSGLSGCTGIILLGETPTKHSAFAHEVAHIINCKSTEPYILNKQHNRWQTDGTCAKIRSLTTGVDDTCEPEDP